MMKKNVCHSLLAMLLACAVATPASSRDEPAGGTNNKAADPNQVVCEKIQMTGSRLAVKRICKTRAQWALERLSDRQDVERIQVQRGSCEGC
jgi:hypothetical protein